MEISETAKLALRRSIKEINTGKDDNENRSYQWISSQIDNFVYKDKGIENHHIERGVIQKWVTGETKEFRDQRSLMALYYWVLTNHQDIYDPLLEEENIKMKTFLARETRALLGIEDKIEMPELYLLRGRFKLYRPFFHDPDNKVMICSLEMGKKDNPFFCNMEMKYPSVTGTSHEGIAGTIIPLKTKTMAILRSASNTAFVMMIDHMDKESKIYIRKEDEVVDGPRTEKEYVLALKGVILTGGGQNSSAYPFYAHRVEEAQVECEVVESNKVPTGILRHLDCGYVHWEAPPSRVGAPKRRAGFEPS